MDFFDPMAELGLIHDKQFICSAPGFLQTNNGLKDVCKRFIKAGDGFYDRVSRYEDISRFILSKDGRSGKLLTDLAIFLKGSGVSDHDLANAFRDSLRVMPGATETMRYIVDTMPSYIVTDSFEHEVLALSEALHQPEDLFVATPLELDQYDMRRQTRGSVAEMVSRINANRLSTVTYRVGKLVKMAEEDSTLLSICDQVLGKDLVELDECVEIAKEMKPLGSNEKGYFVLDVRKNNMIDFDGTMFVGSDNTDFNALDLVRNGSGLALSFNGDEFAVHGSNVMTLSRDCTVAAVLAQEFYYRGIEAVNDLVSNWDLESLRKREFADRWVVDRMLENNPRKLPEVHLVDKGNVEDLATKSMAYRKKMLASNY